MSTIRSTIAQTTGRSKFVPRFSLIRELMLWNKAWQEHRRLHRLDAEALADMGISQAARDAVTVSQIASRLRR